MSRKPSINFSKNSLFRAVAADANLPVRSTRVPDIELPGKQIAGTQLPQEEHVHGLPEAQSPPTTMGQSPVDMRPAKSIAVALRESVDQPQEHDDVLASADLTAPAGIATAPTAERPDPNNTLDGVNDGQSKTVLSHPQKPEVVAAMVKAVSEKPNTGKEPISTKETSRSKTTTTIARQIAQEASSPSSGLTSGKLPQPPVSTTAVPAIAVSENNPEAMMSVESPNAEASPQSETLPPQPADAAHSSTLQSAAEAIIATMIDVGNHPRQALMQHPENRQHATNKPVQTAVPKVHIGSLEIRIDPPKPAPQRKPLAPVSYSGSSIASRRYLRNW